MRDLIDAKTKKKVVTLTHFSERPLPHVKKTEQLDQPYCKPRGLWLSDESQDSCWSTWCEENAFPRGHLRTEFSVDLSDILVLRDARDLREFENEYGVERSLTIPRAREEVIEFLHIRWKAVAELYKGVLATPYLHEECGNHLWYYTWDCASGCFWDPSCLNFA